MKVKLVLAEVPSASVTVTVMVVLPCSSAFGKMKSDRLGPLPSIVIPRSETSFGFDERAVTTKLAVDVSVSPIVNENGPAGRFTSVVLSPIWEIVGGEFLADGWPPPGG